MSIALMSAAFRADIKATPKLVLLALCDCANDQGECYPSIPTLMEKCSSAERTVQDAVAFLERGGFLQREFRTGRSTIYWIADPRKWRTPPPQTAHPAAAAPPQQPHHTPAAAAPPPPQQPHPTPAVAAPITIIEPSVEPSMNQHPHTVQPTEAARVCVLMRKSGMADVNPGHPDLLALLAAGASDAEFEHAARESGQRGKGFAYAMGMLKRQRLDAAALPLHRGPMPSTLSPRERAKAERIFAMTGGLMGTAPTAKKEFIDAEPNRRPALG